MARLPLLSIGDSVGLVLPRELLETLGWRVGDEVEVSVEGG